MVTLEDVCRFWLYVDRKSDEECWLWTGTITGKSDIYRKPSFRLKRENLVAYRVSYFIHNNYQDPGDFEVCHECDNSLCVNPKHLFLGTHSMNMKDMCLKRRRVHASRRQLSDDDVRNIRKLREEGLSLQRIAEMYNVSKATIHKIDSGQRYNHID